MPLLNRYIAQLILTGLLGAVFAAPQSKAGPETTVPGDTENARVIANRALSAAEASVAQAASKKALWTVAVEALDRARAAYAKEDFERAASEANTARDFAELGIAQTCYPAFEVLP